MPSHSFTFPETNDSKNIRILYRLYGPSSLEYVFIAVTNHIYQLDSYTLEMVNQRRIGPKNFSIFCMPDGGDCNNCVYPEIPALPLSYTSDYCGPRMADAEVKAWATSTVSNSFTQQHLECPLNYFIPEDGINDDRIACEDALYVCYNVHHGFCERLKLSNISIPTMWHSISKPNPSRPEEIPTVGVDPRTSDVLAVGSCYVHVATEPDDLDQYTLIKHHPLSVRLRNFQLASSPPLQGSSLSLTIDSPFPIQYYLAFRYHGPFGKLPKIYFVLEQPESMQVYRLQPNIARICENDTHFYSYVELKLACRQCMLPNQDHKIFNALHGAVRGEIGDKLINEQITEHASSPQERDAIRNVLMVAFAPQHVDPLWYQAALALQQINSQSGSHGLEETLSGTAVALFSMAQIDSKFSHVISKCLRGDGVPGPMHFISDRERSYPHCVPDATYQSHADYCPTYRPLNGIIMGHTHNDTVESPAFLFLDHTVTGLAVTSISDQFSVAIFITSVGRLLKYEITSWTSARLVDSIQLTDRRPLISLTLNLDGTIAFVTSSNKVIRVELSNCTAYRTCTACLDAKDPYCGWCVIEGKCLLKTECNRLALDRLGVSKSSQKSNKNFCKQTWSPKRLSSPLISPFTWMDYTKLLTECPVIGRVHPSGVHVSFPSTTFSDSERQSLNFTINGHLAYDVYHLLNPPSTMIRDHIQPHQSTCAFRIPPDHFLYSGASTSGLWNLSDNEKALLNLTDVGRLLARTPARLQIDNVNTTSVRCPLPSISDLLSIPVGKASVQIILWLEWESNEGVKELHTALSPALFNLYNCTLLSDCHSCTQRYFDCVWCILEDRCISNQPYINSSCLQHKVDHTAKAISTGHASECPSYRLLDGPLTVLSGSPLTVNFQVHSAKQELKYFSCEEGCTKQRSVAAYTITDSVVTCHFEKLRVSEPHNWTINLEDVPNMMGVMCDINLFWHSTEARFEEEHAMINEDRVQVEIYKCEWLANFCDSCLMLPTRFRCGWCSVSGERVGSSVDIRDSFCSSSDQCNSTPNYSKVQWLQPKHLCPNPQITSLFPRNGTLTGQTILRIEGRNLGRTVHDFSAPILLKGPSTVACILLPASYLPSRAFECQLESVFSTLPSFRARLEIVIGTDQFNATSPVFEFLTPTLDSIEPKLGPLAGGTLISLHGQYLNIGAERVILFRPLLKDTINTHLRFKYQPNYAIPCDIMSESDHHIICRTRALPLMPLRSATEHSRKRSPPSSQAEASRLENELAIPMSVLLRHDLTFTKVMESLTFSYMPNPHITIISRQNVLASGGTSIHVEGEFLHVVQKPAILFYSSGVTYTQPCEYLNKKLLCISPTLPPIEHKSRSSALSEDYLKDQNLDELTSVESQALPELNCSLPMDINFGFMMDNVTNLRVFGTITVHSDPVVHPFPGGLRQEEFDGFESSKNLHDESDSLVIEKSSEPTINDTIHVNTFLRSHQLLRLYGEFESLIIATELAGPDELWVTLGESHSCVVTSIMVKEIRCDLDRTRLVVDKEYAVAVRFGQFLTYQPGKVMFISRASLALRNQLIMIGVGIFLFFIFIGFVGLAIWRRFDRQQRNDQAKADQHCAEVENRLVRIFKEDFKDLQTYMSDFSQGVKRHNLPFRDYRTFCLFSLFPDYHSELMKPLDPHICGYRMNENIYIPNYSHTVPLHPLLTQFSVPVDSVEAVSKAISLFHTLICNRNFTYTLAHVIDEDEHMTAQAKSHVASLLCAILQSKMDYLTRIMCDLMAEKLQKLHGQGETRLLTAFRRAETVVDKMLSNWLCFLLYGFVKNHVGESLFYFYRALLQQINMGPRDAATGKARYTLDSSMLLRTELTGQPLLLSIEDPRKDFNLPTEKMIVKVLGCDSILQVKEKILDAIYINKAYSLQLKPIHVDLVLLDDVVDREPESVGLLLCDWDKTLPANQQDIPVRLNQIQDFNITNNSRIAVMRCYHQLPERGMSSPASLRSDGLKVAKGIPSGSLTRIPDPNKYSEAHSIGYPDCNSLFTSATREPGMQSIDDPQLDHNFSSPLESMRPTGMPDPTIWYHLEVSETNRNSLTGVSGPKPSFVSGSNASISRSSDSCCHRSTSNCICCKYFRSHPDYKKSPIFAERSWKWSDKLSGVSTVDVISHTDQSSVRVVGSNVNTMAYEQIVESCAQSKSPSNNSKHCIFKRKSRRNSRRLPRKNQPKSASLERLMVSLPKEVFFTRLMVTRMSVDTYMEQLFEVIYSSVLQSQSLPSPIKYLFDFLDSNALNLGIRNPKVVHAWKSNCLQMRFWNQIITNLDYLFDISLLRNTAFERSFHALSQAMTYACAPTKDNVNPDSSSVKLLFYRDISQNWTRVSEYYREIKALPSIDAEDINDILNQHSINHGEEFNVSWAIYELYVKYVRPCYARLISRLQRNEFVSTFKTNALFSSLKRAPSSSIDDLPTAIREPDYMEYDPFELIQILKEIECCMESSAYVSKSRNLGSTSMNEPCYPAQPLTDSSPLLTSFGSNDPHVFPGHTTRKYGAACGDTTDYLDTLRSLNTLKTEFGADDPSRPSNHLHCYQVYDKNERVHVKPYEAEVTTVPLQSNISVQRSDNTDMVV